MSRPVDHPSIAQRIEALGLKNKMVEALFVYEATNHSSLGKCDEDDLATLDKVLEQIESGEVSLPANWYPEGKAPANAGPVEEDNGDQAPGGSSSENSN